MKTIHIYFVLALVFLLSQAHAQSPSVTYAEKTGQSWLTNYYGKPLSSLGDITGIKIERSQLASPAVTNQMHVAVGIIEHSKIQDYYSLGVATDLPPIFSVEYADGLRVRASHYVATITLPDGRKGAVVLASASP
jgi:hypothetical protein